MKESIVYAQMHSFLESITVSMQFDGLELRLPVDNIIMYGMGGSAISANIINDCSLEFLQIPIDILRYPLLPRYVGSNTLVIISSYSGNTYETLLFYDMVKSSEAQIVVICSGGELAKRATEDHIFKILMPTGLQPRFSIGYTIGYMSRVLSSIGYPQLEQHIKESFQPLIDYREYLESNDSFIKCIAQEIVDSHILIIYPRGLESVAKRWKGQLNENAKTVAFDVCEDEIRISNSNANLPNLAGMAVLLIKPKIFAQCTEKSTAFSTQDLFPNIHVIDINGDSETEVLLKSLMIGDYLSVSIAEEKHVDPLDVSIITELKKSIEKEIRINETIWD